jgi:hypothetical protein
VVHGGRSPFSFSIDERPLRLTVDPHVHLFRRLDPQEIPPTVNSIRGAEALTVVVAASPVERWKSIARRLCAAFGVGSANIVTEAELVSGSAGQGPVLWVGPPTGAARLPVSAGQFTLDERQFTVSGKPYAHQSASFFGLFRANDASGRLVALFLPESYEAAVVQSAKIPHYGKYSYLVFQGPSNIVKQTWPVTSSPVAIDWSAGGPPG